MHIDSPRKGADPPPDAALPSLGTLVNLGKEASEDLLLHAGLLLVDLLYESVDLLVRLLLESLKALGNRDGSLREHLLDASLSSRVFLAVVFLRLALNSAY